MAESDVLIRQATIDDGDAVWPLAREFATSFTPEREPFDFAFSALVSHPETLLCVAELRGRVVGYLLGNSHITFLANGRVCWVEEDMVSADERRFGIGRALMLTAERWASEIGAAYVPLGLASNG